ncbi:MAG: WXG100 family type VII secretion target, partial [Nocardioidaceae bacterium]
MSNPLVEQPDADETGVITGTGNATDATAGTGLFGDSVMLIEDAGEGGKTLVGDIALVGFDLLGAVMDPLGSLAAAGVGWLIEHISFLHTALDKLAGDPAVISAKAQTWKNISQSLDATSAQLQDALKKVEPHWQGTAAQNYHATAAGYHDSLKAVASQSNGAASMMNDAGALVGAERGLIRDLIAAFVGPLIVKALAALALAWCTAGGSIAAFITDTVIEGGILAGKIAARIGKLATKIAEFA